METKINKALGLLHADTIIVYQFEKKYLNRYLSEPKPTSQDFWKDITAEIANLKESNIHSFKFKELINFERYLEELEHQTH